MNFPSFVSKLFLFKTISSTFCTNLLELKVSVKALGDVLDAPPDGRESAEAAPNKQTNKRVSHEG